MIVKNIFSLCENSYILKGNFDMLSSKFRRSFKICVFSKHWHVQQKQNALKTYHNSPNKINKYG